MLTGQGRRAWHSAAGPARAGRAAATGRAGRGDRATRARRDGQAPGDTGANRPEGAGRSRRGPWSLLPWLTAGLALTAVLVNGALQAFLGVAAGVLALVSFSSAVLWGLAATDRLVLYPVHRLAAQAIHRTMGIGGVVFLVLHVWMNLIQHQIGALAAFVPFTDPRKPVLMGLGVLAGYVLLAVAFAGAARGLLARTGEARRWRIVHILAYPAWGAGLIHGLNAGRLPASWVTVMYGAAVVGVILALGLRLALQERGAQGRSAVPRRPETVGPPPAGTAAGAGSGRGRRVG
ncbi:hypothetical protein GCM10010440_50930 [Kitasatospora cinereorecta]